jgi:hypothetical protein
MKVILAGYGEVGKGIFGAWRQYHDWMLYDPAAGFDIENPCYCDVYCDVLAIAFPYSKTFVEDVKALQERFHPEVIVVFSTVPIGTCDQISEDTVHSPVEGRHDKMSDYLQEHVRYIGGENELARAFFSQCGIEHIKWFSSSTHTEFLKLRSLAIYGVNVELARWSGHAAKAIDLDYKFVKDYDRDYNKLNFDMGLPDLQRYVLDPPIGKIGGHCVLQNMEILNEQMMHPFFELTIKMQDDLAKMEEEI